MDPPFFTKANYNQKVKIGKDTVEHLAYSDKWNEGLEEFLEVLYPRLFIMRELLSERGSIYLHLDYRTVHYVKIIMDEIFGQENFINEIIWSYKSGGVGKRSFSRKHDTILLYSKTENYIFNQGKEKSYNRGLKPYRFKNVKEFQDNIGWYTLVNMKDIWNIDMVGRTSKERLGYDTQKPEKLLERIIRTSSNEGSIVADFFAGSGTTGKVAEGLNRKWILADKSLLSKLTIIRRLNQNFHLLEKELANNKIKIKYSLEKKQNNRLIKINKYSIDRDNLSIKSRDNKIIDKYIKEDPLVFISYIGLDENYNGKEINITKEYIKKDWDMDDEILIDGKASQVYLLIFDIFGNEFRSVIRGG